MPEVSRRSPCAAAGKDSGMAAGAAAPSGSGPTARLANRHLTSAPASDPCNLPATRGQARRRGRDGDGARPRPVRWPPNTFARWSAPSPISDRRRLYAPLPIQSGRPRSAGAAPLAPRPGNCAPMHPPGRFLAESARSQHAAGPPSAPAASDGTERAPSAATTQGSRTDVHFARHRRPEHHGSARASGRRRHKLLPERTRAP